MGPRLDDPILVPSETAIARANLPDYLRDATRKCRGAAVSALRQAPAFISAVEKLASGTRYRVLVSKEHVHLLSEGADGITKTTLRGAKGHFVENVGLVRIPPDIAGALAVLATSAAFNELSMKLNAIARNVENLDALVRNVNLGGLQGAINALEIARGLHDDEVRRTCMLLACGQLLGEIGKIAGQLKAHVVRMPVAETSFWSGWSDDGPAQAALAWKVVLQDMAVLGEGLRQIVGAHLDLGEVGAAESAFSRICAGEFRSDLQIAVDRARLLPYPKGGPGPEHVFEEFLCEIPIVAERLRILAAGQVPDLELAFEAEEHGDD
jgi:hypothetical protein